IVLQLSYKDVYLSHFYKTKKIIESLNSGDIMAFDEIGCLDKSGSRILVFSGKFKEEMKKYINKGYRPFKARVNHLLFWKQEDLDFETLIVLPHLELIKD
ncbi:MAG: hypothetical protein PHE29_10725, partial [Tissierellia bacterium]|nr:hypothetical protein [Tissierellia bacterium]